jgi:hypothetical protein
MSIMQGWRTTTRQPLRIGGKALKSTQTILINLESKRVFRDLARQSIATNAIAMTAPFFQNDDGNVSLGGVVTNRATGLTLDVTAGQITRADGSVRAITAGTVTVGAADATNPRVDTVVADTTSGAVSVIAGTATAGASTFTLTGRGTVPANRVVLAYVVVPATATNLTAANVVDARP